MNRSIKEIKDVHNASKRMEYALKTLENKGISEENKKLIRKFVNHCLSEGIGKLRVVKYIYTLAKLAEKLEKDEMLRGVVERYFQLSAEVVLDVAIQLIAEFRYRTPEDYKDSLLILGEEGILPEKFTKRFSEIAGFRNIRIIPCKETRAIHKMVAGIIYFVVRKLMWYQGFVAPKVLTPLLIGVAKK